MAALAARVPTAQVPGAQLAGTQVPGTQVPGTQVAAAHVQDTQVKAAGGGLRIVCTMKARDHGITGEPQ